LKSSDTVNTLLLARLRTMLQNQPTNERPQKFATEPPRLPHLQREFAGLDFIICGFVLGNKASTFDNDVWFAIITY